MARTLERPRQGRLAATPAALGGLLRRLPRNHGALAILACIVLITSFSLAALPGFVNRMSDDGLRRSISDAQSFERHISLTQIGATPRSANGTSNVPAHSLADVESLGTALKETMPPLVQGAIARQTVVADGPRWLVRGLPGAPPVLTQRYMQLRIQSGIEQQITVTEGRLPARRTPTSYAQVTGTTAQGSDVLLVYETAISRATAERMEVKVGDRLLATADPVYLRDTQLRAPPANYRIMVEIVGLIDTVAPTDDYWLGDASLQRPGVFETPDVTMVYSIGLLAPDAFGPLLTDTSPEPWTYQWRYFIDAQRLKQSELADFEASVRRLSLIFPSTTRVRTGLINLAERFTDQRLFAVSVLALAAAGVAATALTVLGVLAALLAERRRAGIALVRSRGASAGQIAATQAIEGLVVALPAALIGGAAAIVWRRAPNVGLSILAALATAVAATAVLVAATRAVAGQNLGAIARRQVEARRAAAPRLVLEALVLIPTATGIVLLRRRGPLEQGQLARSLPGGGADPARPPRAAWWCCACCRRWHGRRMAWPEGGGLIDCWRSAACAAGGAQLATVAVLLAVALATFATIIQGRSARALSEASWQQVGADYRVDMLRRSRRTRHPR
ncbi:MAG: hypothetical protein U0232_03560 [Thermomicrobiales bacterium]